MQAPRHHPVPHGLHHLDDPTHTCGGHAVTDVGLERPQIQRTPLSTPLPISGQQRLRLDRITQPGPRPVRLHHVHIGRGQPRVLQRRTNHPLLSRTVGSGQSVGGTVLIHRAAPHQRQNPMTMATGVRQTLHHQQPHTLRPRRPVGIGREGPATTIRGKGPLPAEFHEGQRSGHDGGSPGQRQIALTRTQSVHRHVQGHQGRGTGRVHRYRRALEPEGVGDPAGRDAAGTTASEVPFHLGGEVGEAEGSVSLESHPGVDAGSAAPQPWSRDTGVLQRLPHRLQQQPLLRIGRQRLTRRHPEELRIEPIRVVEETTPIHIGLAQRIGIGIEQPFQVPPPVLGKGTHHLFLGLHQPPQTLRALDPTGKTAGHTHHRDRLPGRTLDLPQPLTRLTGISNSLPQVLAQFLLVSHVLPPSRKTNSWSGPVTRYRR